MRSGQNTQTQRQPVLGRLMGSVRRIRPWHAAVIGAALTATSLWSGFSQDDYVFLSLFQGSPGLEELREHPWDSFTFSDGDPDKNRIRMERGSAPWWTAPDWKIDLWRPLASLSLWVEFELYGRNPVPMHATSVLIYGLSCAAMCVMYRRLIPGAKASGPLAAGLATLLFAIDAGHGISVGWLSNRHMVMTTLVCALTLIAHHRWRASATAERPNGDWMPHAIVANGLLVVGLFCGEGAAALGAYFFAYALFLDPVAYRGGAGRFDFRGFARAFAYLLPYLAVVIVWQLLYTGLGHGMHDSWLYVDPIDEFAAFVSQTPEYFLVYLLGLIGTPDSGAWPFLPETLQTAYIAASALFAPVFAWCMWPLLKSSKPARFFAVSALISMIPLCATVPTDRTLMLSSIGAMGLVGLFLAEYAVDRSQDRARRSFAVVLIGIHVVVAGLSLPFSSYCMGYVDKAYKRINDIPSIETLDPEDRYIVISTPVDLIGASLPIFRSATEQELPGQWYWLNAGATPVTVERTDDRTLVLTPEGGFLQRPWAIIFRRFETNPFNVGDRVELPGMTVEVLKVAEGRPLVVAFAFDRPLDDPAFKWLTWSEDKYAPFVPPPVGTRVEVPGVDFSIVFRNFVRMHLP